MKCLIIAAGKGRRLQKKGQCKPLIPLFGVALIERTIESALEAGADDFYVVTGHHHERVDAFLKRLSNRLNIPIQTVFNEKWQNTDNGISVLRAMDHLHEPFLLLMTDHVFDPGIARDLIQAAENQDGLTLAVDSQLDNPLVDLDDVTRVCIEQGRIVAIGKNLEHFNAYDTGIFLCTASIFDALTQASLATGNTGLSSGVELLAATGQAHTFDIDGRFWIDVDDPITFWRAENALLTRFQQKPEDVPA
ncbi:MAG: NTP transferase domain-containing protein [Mariprofundus sp.]|nr:NTP transferase domain-containing protein [Mariprofundus sp.]